MSDSPLVPEDSSLFPSIPEGFDLTERELVDTVLKPFSQALHTFDLLKEQLREAEQALRARWDEECRLAGYDPVKIPELEKKLREYVQAFIHRGVEDTGELIWIEGIVRLQHRQRLVPTESLTEEQKAQMRAWARPNRALWKLSSDRKVLEQLASWLYTAGLFDYLDLDTRALLQRVTESPKPIPEVPTERYWTNFTDGTWGTILGTLRLLAEFDQGSDPGPFDLPQLTIPDLIPETLPAPQRTAPKEGFSIQIQFSSTTKPPETPQLTPGDQ